MPEYSRQNVQFACKQESAEGGTAIALAAADANLKILDDFSWEPDLPFYPVNGVAGEAGSWPGVSGGIRSAVIKISVPLIGSGTPATPPSWGKLLKDVAGFVEAIVALTSVSYTYSKAGFTKALTCILNIDGKQHMIHGARARSVEIVGNNGEYLILRVEFLGVYNEPSDVAAFASVSYESTKAIAILGGNFLIDSYAMKFKSFGLKVENKSEIIPACGSTRPAGAFSCHAAPGVITGSIDPNQDAAATYNFWNKITTNNEGALVLPVAGAAGNIITITAPKTQYSKGAPGARGHSLLTNLDLQLNRSSGDDALVITQT